MKEAKTLVEILYQNKQSLLIPNKKLMSRLQTYQEDKGDKPPFVVSIIGPARCGKSSLLNFLLGDACFAVEHTTKPCTKGVSALYRNNTVFLDFEGMHSMERDSIVNEKMLLLALQVSDVVLFNVTGVIGNSNLEQFKFVEELARTNNLKKKMGCSLVFVVRDFALEANRGILQDCQDQLSKLETFDSVEGLSLRRPSKELTGAEKWTGLGSKDPEFAKDLSKLQEMIKRRLAIKRPRFSSLAHFFELVGSACEILNTSEQFNQKLSLILDFQSHLELKSSKTEIGKVIQLLFKALGDGEETVDEKVFSRRTSVISDGDGTQGEKKDPARVLYRIFSLANSRLASPERLELVQHLIAEVVAGYRTASERQVVNASNKLCEEIRFAVSKNEASCPVLSEELAPIFANKPPGLPGVFRSCSKTLVSHITSIYELSLAQALEKAQQLEAFTFTLEDHYKVRLEKLKASLSEQQDEIQTLIAQQGELSKATEAAESVAARTRAALNASEQHASAARMKVASLEADISILRDQLAASKLAPKADSSVLVAKHKTLLKNFEAYAKEKTLFNTNVLNQLKEVRQLHEEMLQKSAGYVDKLEEVFRETEKKLHEDIQAITQRQEKAALQLEKLVIGKTNLMQSIERYRVGEVLKIYEMQQRTINQLKSQVVEVFLESKSRKPVFNFTGF